MSKPIEITKISTLNTKQVDGYEPVWCVEFTQGTTSSYRYVSAADEVGAFKKFWEKMESISTDIPKEKNDEQR